MQVVKYRLIIPKVLASEMCRASGAPSRRSLLHERYVETSESLVVSLLFFQLQFRLLILLLMA
jgi:hypothetical protein